MVKPFFLAALLVLAACDLMPVAAQEIPHVHGVNVPDWYDINCCNQRDCRPVEADEEQPMPFLADRSDYTDDNGDVWTQEAGPAYRWQGHIFRKLQFRPSQDERYHVCFSGSSDYCIYLPTQV